MVDEGVEKNKRHSDQAQQSLHYPRCEGQSFWSKLCGVEFL